jgi:hypothetical protein
MELETSASTTPRDLATQLEIVEGGTQFEQSRALATGEITGGGDIGEAGVGVA